MEDLRWRLHFLKIKNKCFEEEEEQKEKEIAMIRKNKGKIDRLEIKVNNKKELMIKTIENNYSKLISNLN